MSPPNFRARTTVRNLAPGTAAISAASAIIFPIWQDLGVTTLWLTPVVKNAATEDYHGYGAVDLYAVDPHLGTLDDYKDLVSAAHQRRMKIFFDSVPNHVGPRHPWVAKLPSPIGSMAHSKNISILFLP